MITTKFNFEEFACKDGTRPPTVYRDNLVMLASNLQKLRNAIGLPIQILSGYRTLSHNQKVGGAPKSQHLTAKAADIQVYGLTPKEVAAEIRSLIKHRQMWDGGLGVYETFVHYDIRGRRARWRG